MLWLMAFDRVGVVASDLYFLDPEPEPQQEGAERGVRLELRLLERDELKGSMYSSVPIRVGRPLWRVDLLESVASTPGSLDRAHHHPRFDGWEPGPRIFEKALSSNPIDWLRDRFAAIQDVLAYAAVSPGMLGPHDVEDLRAAGPSVIAVINQLLQDVVAGRAGLAPDDAGHSIRSSWL